MHVTFNPALQQRIYAQMEAAYPNEGGGFLLGRVQQDKINIEDITQVENTFAEEEQYHRYQMNPQDWARLEDAADARGLTLLGYYHSHPNAAAIPSVYDRDHALPNFIYVITSVREGHAVEIRAWQLRTDRTEFDALNLVIR